MECEFLYRYISFESFVGMVQKNALTFVLPSIWDDPQENIPFIQFVDRIDTAFNKAFFVAMHNKIYAQSWSSLSESDAMWRIYAYNNRAVRIKVSRSKLDLLDNVKVVPVTYSDEPFDCEKVDIGAFNSSLAYKRTAFSHEQEVRLIKGFKYRDDQDIELHIKALMVVNEHPQYLEVIDSVFPGMEFEEKLVELIKLLNLGKYSKKTCDISYSHIPGFIEGVLVHPMAPDWYIEVVQEDLTQEEKRYVREGFSSDEELSMFDLLFKADLSKQEITMIKKVAVDLLAKVKSKIAELDHWADKPETKAIMDNLIRDTLWAELPESYDEISITTYRKEIYEYIYLRYKTAA